MHLKFDLLECNENNTSYKHTAMNKYSGKVKTKAKIEKLLQNLNSISSSIFLLVSSIEIPTISGRNLLNDIISSQSSIYMNPVTINIRLTILMVRLLQSKCKDDKNK